MKKVQLARTSCPVCQKISYGTVEYSAGNYAQFMCIECHGTFMGKINQQKELVLHPYDSDKHLTNPSRRDNAFPPKRFINSDLYKQMKKKHINR